MSSMRFGCCALFALACGLAFAGPLYWRLLPPAPAQRHVCANRLRAPRDGVWVNPEVLSAHDPVRALLCELSHGHLYVTREERSKARARLPVPGEEGVFVFFTEAMEPFMYRSWNTVTESEACHAEFEDMRERATVVEGYGY